MSSATLAKAIATLHQKARHDEALAETVFLLTGDPDGPEDPFATPEPAALAAARLVDRRRQRRARATLDQAALDTAAAVRLIGSIHDRKGIDRRRQRGQLLGWRQGRRVLHPAWQFDLGRGDTRPGLARVLAALREVAPEPRAAHALMTAPREDLDGATLADLFARDRVELVERLILGAGDQA
ncbi:MAG TPA: hypothetical protein VMV46_21770 [Thermoanaerobaculia bacterium]|nr:hypothetical protein [Thermoanaerobaculia bacterium]